MPRLTTAQTAERLRVSIRTVHRMIGDGELTPAEKLPTKTGPYLFEEDEVERARGTREAARSKAATAA